MRLLILNILFVVWQIHGVIGQSTNAAVVSTTAAPVKPATYMLVAPAVVRPDQPFSVCMNLLKQATDEDMIVRIEVRTERNETIAARVISNLKPGIAQTVSLSEMPAQSLTPRQSYKLYIRGETLNAELIFENENELKYDQKALSVFIQTDRAIYRPASLVRYRAIVVKSDLKPYVGNATIKIFDPSRNLISQTIGVTLDRGVYSGELQLAEETLLGDWFIEVETSNGVQDKSSFTVDTYVLPKFEVNIKTSSFITINDDLSVFVDAKYTYGKGVAGKAKVSLELPWHRWHAMVPTIIDENGVKKEEELMVERTVKLNRQGEAAVVFSNDELKRHKLLHEWGGGSIRIVASVTEDITEIERNATHQISTFREEVKLDVEKQGDTFKPGLTYNVVVALKQMDDTPVKATLPKRVQVSTFYNYPYNHDTSSLQEEKETKIVEVDAHGTSVLTLQPPINCTSARIEAHYDIGGKDNFTATPIYSSLYVEAAVSPTKSFLQLLADNEGAVDVGKSLSFSLKATQPLSTITYQVMSRSNIVVSQQMTVNSEHATISFPATANMAPKSRLIVYAIIESSQEVLVDALDFKVEGIFQNQVALSIDKQAVEPGQNVKFKVTSDKNSFVGLLVVDQSVLLLKTGNDITREKVEQDLENYDSNNVGGGFGGPRPWEAIDRKKRSIWRPWWGIGGSDAQSIFSNAGLVVLTDALLYREPQREFMSERRLNTPGGLTVMMMDGAPGMAEAAFAAPPMGGSSPPPPTVRKFFPHTWIWSDLNSTSGEVEMEIEAPDTITSWVASTFAINEENGLGVAPTTSKLRVFRPFFIQLNLPYAVRRGEKFALLVLVFNYMEKEQDVTVTLKYDKDSGYDLLKKDGTVVRRDEVGQQNVRIVSVAGGGTSKAVYFPIVPSSIGEIPVHISAIASQGGDAVEMNLRVDPQGYKVDRNIPFVIDLNNNSSDFSKNLELIWPNDVVDGSQKARLDVIGDMMGPVLNNAHKLVQMPYGCGEQNMLNLVPNILVVKYLRATNRNESQLETKAIKFIEQGIQRELTYKRADNSFSAFGDSDKAGSTWLTAFVVRSFHHAKQYAFVDPNVISRAVAFLNSQQMESGAFAERGEVHHKDMQGGAQDGGVALTAFVLISILENGMENGKAVTYLEKHLDEVSGNAYTMAVVAYALQLAKSKQAGKAFENLKKHKIVEKSGDVKFASAQKKVEKLKESRAYMFQARPVDIETTSYAVLSYLAQNQTSESLSIIRWLVSQRNELGGFTSTQDTVMALQALSSYAAVTYSDKHTSQVTILNGKHTHSFDINIRNAIVLQSYQLSSLNDAVSINANGTGVVFAQLSYSYYRDSLNDDAPFFCSQEIKEIRAGNRLQLDLCCNYTRPGKSNMALAEIDALSGYRFDAEQVHTLTSIEDLQRVEMEKDDTKMNVYFNPLGGRPVCLSLYSDVTYQVADQKPANFRLVDYYDPEEQLKMTYAAKQTRSLQEKCGEDCWPPISPSLPPFDESTVTEIY
ncbi:TEP1-F [Caenorhabditis elegans]|uniref:TEP1-F n=1 Tax=Caenorhabditis elegans TaxID=6239 RepID=O46015_CAEEL|nr:TEP (ThiolEster containing Protein) [Caenorhabditis elegans]CAB05007.2 TEP (ThiolEster containing Protein) [Caenorhabditis elegans]|eukprot:NP_493613.2 TEP (ThiolEster containing Protein) [Caenorhabditis elegans]